MTTKAPSPVQDFPSTSLEKVAYSSVSTIPTAEPNDRYRLGYHIWRMLAARQGTLAEAIAESGARLEIPLADARRIISDELTKQGISFRE